MIGIPFVKGGLAYRKRGKPGADPTNWFHARIIKFPEIQVLLNPNDPSLIADETNE